MVIENISTAVLSLVNSNPHYQWSHTRRRTHFRAERAPAAQPLPRQPHFINIVLSLNNATRVTTLDVASCTNVYATNVLRGRLHNFKEHLSSVH